MKIKNVLYKLRHFIAIALILVVPTSMRITTLVKDTYSESVENSSIVYVLSPSVTVKLIYSSLSKDQILNVAELFNIDISLSESFFISFIYALKLSSVKYNISFVFVA